MSSCAVSANCLLGSLAPCPDRSCHSSALARLETRCGIVPSVYCGLSLANRAATAGEHLFSAAAGARFLGPALTRRTLFWPRRLCIAKQNRCIPPSSSSLRPTLPPKSGSRGCGTGLWPDFLDRTEGNKPASGRRPPALRNRFKIMANLSQTSKTAKGKKPARLPITFERAKLLCPNAITAEKVAQTFALDLPDYNGIRETHERFLRQSWLSFDDALNDQATLMHFQRVTGSLVSSAFGAGNYYSLKVSEARNLTSSLANDHRDEDRDAPIGFDSKAHRVREWAAKMAMQAYALLAAAEGAVTAYKEITGEDWKPYVAENEASQTVERKSSAAEMSAFG